MSGHLLIGSSLLDSPVSDDQVCKFSTRYRLWRAIVDSFWNSWRRSCLCQLQYRSKWKNKGRNVTTGDVVLVSNPNESVMSWPLGKVIEVFLDSAGVVRNVMFKTESGVFKRSVQRLVLLPVNE